MYVSMCVYVHIQTPPHTHTLRHLILMGDILTRHAILHHIKGDLHVIQTRVVLLPCHGKGAFDLVAGVEDEGLHEVEDLDLCCVCIYIYKQDGWKEKNATEPM